MAFLTDFLNMCNFLLGGIFFGSSRGSFSKICPKRTFLSGFVELGSEILYLFLSEKMVVCFVCSFVRFFVCLFVCLLQLCPILAYFFTMYEYAYKDVPHVFQMFYFDFIARCLARLNTLSTWSNYYSGV